VLLARIERAAEAERCVLLWMGREVALRPYAPPGAAIAAPECVAVPA
jgi:hypothetical protein